MNQPNLNKAVRVQNSWNQSVEVRFQVLREATNETVHHETYEISPDTERTVYNVSEAEPDGIETFTVIATVRNSTKQVTIKTNTCYGDAYAEILKDGTLYLYHAIC